MIMTAFSMPCWKSALFKRLLGRLFLPTLLTLFAVASQAQTQAEIPILRAERSGNEVFVSANVSLELPTIVEDALLKGVPMFFMLEADLYLDRWYWYDKRISGAQRQLRLAYQPLTRRWRVTQSLGMGSDSSQGLSLNQSYESLAEALSVVRQVSRWKVAELADTDPTTKIKLLFRFRLDLSQLPRPFQIGAIGQSEWDIQGVARTALREEAAK
jgi:hypothetical protein